MNNDKKLKVVSYGEVLWDVFDNEKKIGGAPLNVALRMKALGCDVAMISCVGDDADGIAIMDHVKSLGLDTNAIIKSEEFPTGLVQVSLNDKGSASYEINYPSAWDKIVLNTTARKLVAEADVLIYGSLVCRDSVSRLALEELLKNDVYKVFDVNLRKPHYSYEIIESLMQSANFIKFNDEELLEIAVVMDSPFKSLEENMEFIAQKTNSKAMCVTKGKYGASLLWEGKLYHNDGYSIKVADTVGAGDSFLGALITSLLVSNDNPQKSIDFACAVGALVAEAVGANPEISFTKIEELMLKGF
ncbi:carbohydrate kinase [Flavobacterium sp. F-65]|uniref:Carbohydrate kinase n=1 Tax=Flavobacterium pisciphilum TaxID=2893755 RepID=A0ABS8MPM8_9FLAO|nr:carbohydrate kinase [Flavobacterium sp. F-65]MCC9070718.1 carbohydrate kinase [Flavobacterium sp. F-65]